MTRYTLEHFYYGQTVQEGKVSTSHGVLAASPGIMPEHVSQAVDRLKIPPLISTQNGSVALIRGRSRLIPFLMAQAQQGDSGQVVTHYIVFQPDSIRAIGGNVDLLRGFVQEKMPVFTGAKIELKPLDLFDPPTLNSDTLIDHILELMTVAKNQTAVIETMLGAIVQSVPLYVQGAPNDLAARVQFLQGLLALLPTSARFGVTFATHSLPSTNSDVQIRFFSDDAPPPDVVVFNWATGRVSGKPIDNEYARFVISQLRLDAELVILRNVAMAAIAGWRLNQGDNLSESLGYASLRLKVDSSLANNQPVNKEDVARILTEDPTLSSDLQITYALHLLRLGLAMRDLDPATPVAILLRSNERLERAVLKEMNDALTAESSRFLYKTLLRWMNNPLGPQGFRWVDLTHRATLTYLQELVAERDIDRTISVIKELQDAGSTLQIDEFAPKIIKLTLPLSTADARVAQNLFLLGLRYLTNEPFQQLMGVERFRAQLNPQLSRAWGIITSGSHEAVDTDELLRAAKEYGERWEPLILMRFAHTAYRMEYYDLLTAGVLKALSEVANSSEGREHMMEIKAVVNAVEQNALSKVGPAGGRYILQTHLALGDYEALARGMLQQLRVLYLDLQEEYMAMIYTVFTETQVPISRVNIMLEQINAVGVKTAPFLMAMVSVVQNHCGEPEIEPTVNRIVDELSLNRHYLEVVPPPAILGLLDHYALRRDVDGMRSVVGIIPYAVEGQGAQGIRTVAQVYRKTTWSLEAQAVGLDILRASVRLQPAETAAKTVEYYVRQFGPEVQRPLDVTLTLHRLLGYRSLTRSAELLNRTVQFFHKLAALYMDERFAPSTTALTEGLNALSGAGGLPPSFLEDVLNVGRMVIRLGHQYQTGKRGNEASYAEAVIGGRTDPASTLDVLRVMSGSMVKGMRFNLQVAPNVTRYPFEDFSMGQLINGFEAARAVLLPISEAMPLNTATNLKTKEISAEMRSLAVMAQDNETLRELACDWQYLVDLVVMIDSTGDAKAFSDGGYAKKIDTGKQKPNGVLEMMRFIYGYYHRQR